MGKLCMVFATPDYLVCQGRVQNPSEIPVKGARRARVAGAMALRATLDGHLARIDLAPIRGMARAEHNHRPWWLLHGLPPATVACTCRRLSALTRTPTLISEGAHEQIRSGSHRPGLRRPI